MSFDWLQYIDVAKHLEKSLHTEGSYRSGISRSYYSVFGRARLFCVNHHILKQSELKGHDIHYKLTTTLKDSDIPEIYEIGSRIDALKIRRQEADYNPFSKDMNSDLLRDSIEKAEEVLVLMDEYSAS